ncbi:MAG: hypothetical protein H3Z54_10045 [archaeon]|nr:hypothetical protein [archaeon]
MLRFEVILINEQNLDERILSYIDRTKKEACRNYGWSFTLYDLEDKDSNYPFIHLKIFWFDRNNQKVIDRVNNEFFYDTEIKYDDLAKFINNCNADQCHNAACSLIENSSIAEWLLSEGIGRVYCDDDEDFEILKKAGLELSHKGKYSCIGRIENESKEKVKIKIKDDGYFIPNKVREITSKKFYSRYCNHDRFDILENSSEDFWYYKDSVIETIKRYRSNPKLFLEDYPILEEILGVTL